MKNLFKVVTVFATLALLVGTLVALSVSATEGDQGATDATATATATETTVETSEVQTTGTEATEIKAGDANADGNIDMKDVLTVRKYLANMDVVIDLDGADAYADGEVNTKDVLALRQFLAGIIDELPLTVDPAA